MLVIRDLIYWVGAGIRIDTWIPSDWSSMKILFSFVGGPFNGAIVSGYSEVRSREDLAAATYYQVSENGNVGAQFSVPRADGEHIYGYYSIANPDKLRVFAQRQALQVTRPAARASRG